LLAGLATLGFILQALIMKEDLFTGSPDEVLVAINASDRPVLILAIDTCRQLVGGFRL